MELDVTGSANIGLGPANATSSGDAEEINKSVLTNHSSVFIRTDQSQLSILFD